MVGITSYGAYVPWWRLSRQAIAPGLSGEKAIANWDEDTVTMAVAAAIDSLRGQDRNAVDGLFFASTTSPYAEKQSATIVAAACGLRRDIITADFANSLRAGTTALRAAVDAVKAGSAKRVLVVAADCRLGPPGSVFEQDLGDGAAALIIGDADVACDIEAVYSIYHEVLDVWRPAGDNFLRIWEDRFVFGEGYSRAVREAVAGLMTKCGLGPKDLARAAFYAPDARRHAEMARALGLDPKTQVQDSLFSVMGNTGCAFPLMLLVAALEDAKAGDRILLASYGNGSDALLLRVTEQVGKIRDRRGMKKHLSSKMVLTDYQTYLQWRGLFTKEAARRPSLGNVSASAIFRERSEIFGLRGSKCQVCGTTQYPPQRICTRCRAKDQFEEVSLAERKGQIFSYSFDYMDPLEVPSVGAIIDFEGGVRTLLVMSDRVLEDIKIGMTVEVSFRKLFYHGGIHNYYWKAVPLRD